MAMKRMIRFVPIIKLASTSELDTTTWAARALATTEGESVVVPMEVTVQGQSGKFTVYPKDAGASAGIQVIMDALSEVDSNGVSVGTSGSQKHSIQTFASQSFDIAAAEDVELEGGVAAVKVSFESQISNVGHIGVDTYIVTQDGDVGPPGEKWAVRVGDLKWNIRLRDWAFCDGTGAGACRPNDVGDSIELVISVKSRAGADDDARVQDNKTVSLGGGSTLHLSNQVYKDDTEWVDMPASYPQVSAQGKTTTITFRFPKFASTVLYDPVIASDGPTISQGDGSTGSTTSSGNGGNSPTTTSGDGSTGSASSGDGSVVAAATVASRVGFASLVSFALMAAGRVQAAF